MKSFLKLSAVGVAALFFSSCARKNEVGKMVPANASFVAQVNLKSLGNKLSWKEIQQTDVYKKITADSSMNDWRRQLLENPAASGIDFDAGLVFFTADNGGSKYFAAEGKIKNQEEFNQFNKNLSGGSASKNDDVNLLPLKNNGVVGWKDDQFIYIMNPGNKFYEFTPWKDSSGATGGNPSTGGSASYATLCAHLFSLKSDSSLAENDRFAAVLKETGDVHVYQNTDAMINNSSSAGALGMLKLDAFTKGNASTYTVNFDNGKIEVSQKLFVSPQLTDIVKKYMGNSVDMDMIKRIPSNNLIGLIAFNFKPAGITEMIKLTGMDGMINSYTQPMGFNLDDFSKATNGNWLLAFTDLNLTDSVSHPDFNYVFAAGIQDKATLEKILTAAKKTTAGMGRDSLLNYVMNDHLFVQSNHSSFASEYLQGKSNSNFDFASKISGHPSGFYLDLHKLLTQLGSLQSPKPGRQEMLDESLKIWNNIIASGGEYKDGGFTFNSEVNLMNKDSNSLQQLSNYINALFLINEKTEAATPDVHRLDSLLAPPPVDTVK